MSKKAIYIFVEGPDDVRFFEYIITPILYKKCKVFLIKYQERKNSIIIKYIQTAKARDNMDYIFLTDMDNHCFNCITSRKDKRINEYEVLDKNRVIVAKEEIESWYISGLGDNCINELKDISIPVNTENLTKEEFDELIPSNFKGSRIDFMLEIAKCFDFNLALSRNNSFEYFTNKIREIIY